MDAQKWRFEHKGPLGGDEPSDSTSSAERVAEIPPDVASLPSQANPLEVLPAPPGDGGRVSGTIGAVITNLEELG